MTGMVLKTAGGLLVVIGTIWALQGLGLLNWPASSFMLAQREWAVYGTVTAVVGAVMFWLGIRLEARSDR